MNAIKNRLMPCACVGLAPIIHLQWISPNFDFRQGNSALPTHHMSTLGTPINRLTHSVCDNHMNGMWEDVLTSGSDNLCFSKVNAYRSLDNLDLFISRIKTFYNLLSVGAHSACRLMSRQ